MHIRPVNSAHSAAVPRRPTLRTPRGSEAYADAPIHSYRSSPQTLRDLLAATQDESDSPTDHYAVKQLGQPNKESHYDEPNLGVVNTAERDYMTVTEASEAPYMTVDQTLPKRRSTPRLNMSDA